MAYVFVKQDKGYLSSLQADTRSDIETLPVAPEVGLGSDCIVIEDSSVWLLNSQNEWKELGEG